ncbi:hypothetical protein FMN52_01675 [Marinobacter sp. BW6]|uniref:YdeI/OmpD-associated family protein n=1 Tax=Marinobacter sp. BW6 TaxID=2592624 RepID=UPI0011DE859C|nr:YdeI/OmpD-associated family protein [Marinobacter sp. BW6]TYC62496.1 hypothetical protein FMN52_01675 [Marinobacter sp. BW6]
MQKADPEKISAFETPESLACWLKEYHAIERELWVKIYKKQTGILSVNWDEVVVESLCWGWIDGMKQSIDNRAYLQRITPRTARSTWSKRNTEHAERLIIEGRMREPGLSQVRAAKSDGRWSAAYKVSEMRVPPDFVKALEARPDAKAFFDSLPKSSRSLIAVGLASAKRAETRERRFDKFIEMLVRQERPK